MLASKGRVSSEGCRSVRKPDGAAGWKIAQRLNIGQPQQGKEEEVYPQELEPRGSKRAAVVVKAQELRSAQTRVDDRFHSVEWTLSKTYACGRRGGGESKKEQIKLFSLSLCGATHLECFVLEGGVTRAIARAPLTPLPKTGARRCRGSVFCQERKSLLGNGKVIKLLEVVKRKLV